MIDCFDSSSECHEKEPAVTWQQSLAVDYGFILPLAVENIKREVSFKRMRSCEGRLLIHAIKLFDGNRI